MADQDESAKINLYSLISPFPEGDVAAKINVYSQIGTNADTVESAKITVYTLIGPGTPNPAPGTILQIGCAKIRILQVVSATQLLGEVLVPLEIELPDDPDDLVPPIPAVDWKVLSEAQVVTGLDHLNGKEVWALADGLVLGPFTVVAGAVDLGDTYSSVVVGLKYTQQLQTLLLDADLIPGTIQGKRKFAPAATLRVDCTRGLKMGIDFEHLTPVPELVNPGDYTLFTGDARSVVFADWNTEGQICVQQDDPLPAAVNGIIVEVVPGDTGR